MPKRMGRRWARIEYSDDNGVMKRQFVGAAVGVLIAVALGAAMLPLRSHLSIATSALVLVIPVVSGVVTGGFVAGLVSVAAGFLVYDLAFIPPYGTLTVSNGQYSGWRLAPMRSWAQAIRAVIQDLG